MFHLTAPRPWYQSTGQPSTHWVSTHLRSGSRFYPATCSSRLLPMLQRRSSDPSTLAGDEMGTTQFRAYRQPLPPRVLIQPDPAEAGGLSGPMAPSFSNPHPHGIRKGVPLRRKVGETYTRVNAPLLDNTNLIQCSTPLSLSSWGAPFFNRILLDLGTPLESRTARRPSQITLATGNFSPETRDIFRQVIRQTSLGGIFFCGYIFTYSQCPGFVVPFLSFTSHFFRVFFFLSFPYFSCDSSSPPGCLLLFSYFFSIFLVILHLPLSACFISSYIFVLFFFQLCFSSISSYCFSFSLGVFIFMSFYIFFSVFDNGSDCCGWKSTSYAQDHRDDFSSCGL